MFSELVDELLTETRRPHQVSEITRFANATIRECQRLALFAKDMVEDQITTTADPQIWTRPRRLYRMRTVRYADGSYPDFLMPGKVQKDKEKFFYGATDYIAFRGAGAIGALIDIAYYELRPRLLYKLPGARPAVFDEETETWSYPLGASGDAQELAARNLVTNWLLDTWRDVIAEGSKAKLFLVAGDERSKSTFALYISMRNDILRSEAYEALIGAQTGGDINV